MDRFTFGIGVIATILGIIIIILSFGENDGQTDKDNNLLTEIESHLTTLSNINFNDYNSKFNESTLSLKMKLEQRLGINCIGEVGLRDYQNLVNEFGLDRIKSDLKHLHSQLSTNL